MMHNRFSIRLILNAVVTAGIVMLSACGPLISFGDDGPADEVYSLRYPGEFSAGMRQGPIIYVDSPIMGDGLDGHEVAVRLAGNQRTSLQGVAWSAHLSDLVRDYVTLALADKTSVNLISEGGVDIKAACRLGIKVWAMEFVPGASAGSDSIDIAIQFSLVRIADSSLLSHPVFSQNVKVNSSDSKGIMQAFNHAMGKAADEYGVWLRDLAPTCGIALTGN